MPARALRPHREGTVLAVSCAPSSGRAALERLADGRLRLRLKEPAERGRANREAERFLGRLFGVPAVLIRGGGRRRKEFLLRGLDTRAAAAIIERHLGGKER